MSTITTTLTWTRYDGTPETLPEGGVTVLLARPDWEVEVWDTQFTSGKWYGRRVNTPLEVGDTWAYWPEAPEVLE